MDEDIRLKVWQDYTADLIGTITQRLYRYTGADGFELPLFSEIIEPEKVKKDNRSAEEIRNHVIQLFSE